MSWYLPDSNPLFWDEIRRRLRGTRSLWLLCAYGIVLAGIVVSILLLEPVARNAMSWPAYGRRVWYLLLGGQGVFMLLIAPGLAAGVITDARQRNTLDFLLLTRLTSRQLVMGFFWGQLGLLLMVVMSSAPVVAIVSAVYGGISPLEVSLGYVALCGLGMLCTSTALLASCRNTSTSTATVQSYALMMLKIILLSLCGALAVYVIYMLHVCVIILFTETVHALWRAVDRMELIRRPIDPMQTPPWEYLRPPDDPAPPTGTPTAPG
ncbi:MAG: ABC transporter permease [Armatimonadota bacterium]